MQGKNRTEVLVGRAWIYYYFFFFGGYRGERERIQVKQILKLVRVVPEIHNHT